MATTTKQLSGLDGTQVLKAIYNEIGAIATEGWVSGLVGRKIVYTIGTTTVANDTALFTYIENGVTMMVLANVYTDGARTTLSYTERMS